MPGNTGVSTPRSTQIGEETFVLGSLEEELGDAEVGQCQLGREEVAVARQVGRARVAGGVRGNTDGEATNGPGQLHELSGVGQLAGAGRRVLGRVAPERHQVLDPGLAERHEDVGQLEPRVGHADDVGHGVEVGRVQQAGHEVDGALPRLGPAAVGHRDE